MVLSPSRNALVSTPANGQRSALSVASATALANFLSPPSTSTPQQENYSQVPALSTLDQQLRLKRECSEKQDQAAPSLNAIVPHLAVPDEELDATDDVGSSSSNSSSSSSTTIRNRRAIAALRALPLRPLQPDFTTSTNQAANNCPHCARAAMETPPASGHRPLCTCITTAAPQTPRSYFPSTTNNNDGQTQQQSLTCAMRRLELLEDSPIWTDSPSSELFVLQPPSNNSPEPPAEQELLLLVVDDDPSARRTIQLRPKMQMSRSTSPQEETATAGISSMPADDDASPEVVGVPTFPLLATPNSSSSAPRRAPIAVLEPPSTLADILVSASLMMTPQKDA